MGELSGKACVPCSGSTPRLGDVEIEVFRNKIDSGWIVEDGRSLTRKFKFHNFKEALAFTNSVGAIAEKEGHHPDILLAWGKVEVTLTTHKIGGLSENDFILASKIDDITKTKNEMI